MLRLRALALYQNRKWGRCRLSNSLQQVSEHFVNGEAGLLHGVTLADGDGAFKLFAFFAEGFEVHGDAEGSSNFVLATITTTNGSAIVVLHVHPLLKFELNFFGYTDLFSVLFEKREDGGFHGSHFGGEAHHGADVGLAAFFGEVLFVEGLAKKSEYGAVASGGWFHDVGDELFFCFIVAVFERLTGSIIVLGEVVSSTIGNPFEFLDTKGELILDVVGFLGVVGALAIGDIKHVQLLARDADFGIPLQALFEPFVSEAEAVVRVAEKFDFHLLKLTAAEDVVAWVDLVAEGLSDLGNTEGEFDSVRVHHVLILHEDGLRGLGAEVGNGLWIIVAGHGAELGGEHEVEGARLSESALFAFAWITRRLLSALESVEAVGTIATFTGFAVDHGIGESAHVAGCGENGLVSEDGAVHAEDVVALLHVATPPNFFDVTLEFGTEGTHVPASIEAAVEFARLEDEALALAEGHDFFHADGIGLVFVGHKNACFWEAELSRDFARKQGLVSELTLGHKSSKLGEFFATGLVVGDEAHQLFVVGNAFL